MQQFRSDTPKKSLSLIISILLHILLLLFFIYFKWDTLTQKQAPSSPEQAELAPEPNLMPDVAALKTGASQFGAPVIFQEEPTFTPPDGQKTPEPEEKKAEPAKPDQEQQEAAQEQAKEPEPEHAEPAQKPATFVAEPVAQKPPISFKPTLPPVPKPEQKKPEPQPIALPAEKKKPSFADLAQGFIQTMKDQGGSDMFERKGNESLRPDMEELKVISYQQKVIWFIQNSFRAHTDEQSAPPEPLVLCPTILTLNADGSIVELQLVQSSGYPAFDTFYLKVIRNAAPFPPVPSHIPKPFTFRFTAQHYTEQQAPKGVKRKKPVGMSMR